MELQTPYIGRIPKSSDNRIISVAVRIPCKICLTYQIDTVFYPCFHACLCSGCASKISICPLCRKKIIKNNRLYLATESTS